MSDMTDAEYMRSTVRRGSMRCERIADLLEAMQWREPPPDTPGDWVRKRPGKHAVFGVPKDVLSNISIIHQPGDRWFKLPPS